MPSRWTTSGRSVERYSVRVDRHDGGGEVERKGGIVVTEGLTDYPHILSHLEAIDLCPRRPSALRPSFPPSLRGGTTVASEILSPRLARALG